MLSQKTWFSIALLALVVSCAKERSIERVRDLDGNRWPKALFQKPQPYFSKVTIVKTSSRSAFGFVGSQSEMRAGYFEFTQDKLRFKSAVSLYGEDVTAGDLINSWGITHSQYRLAESGGRVTNREEEDSTIPWNRKNFFKIHWDSATISESGSFPFMTDDACWSKKDSNVVDGSQVVSDDLIAFTVAVDYEINSSCVNYERYHNQDFTHTIHYRYSFAPMKESDYDPYLYNGENDPLMKKYGYFNTVIQGLNDTGMRTNKFVMERWHPKKTHTYYFAPGFPAEYKWIFDDPKIGVIAKTNELFAKNGLKIRFEIKDAPRGMQVGDVGTSMINFVTQMDEGAPLGYGPHDANPFTGEVVAGNVTIWTAYLKYYVKVLNDQLDREATLSNNSSIFRDMRNSLGVSKTEWTSTAAALNPGANSGNFFRFLLPQYTFGTPGNGFTQAKEENIFRVPSAKKYLDLMSSRARDSIGPQLESMEVAAHDRMQEIVKLNMRAKRATVYELDQPLGEARALLLTGMSEKEVIDAILYRTAIHEFGHNLNLRHNFYGSVDKNHFGPEVDGVDHDGKVRKFQAPTSSVMDYMAMKDEMHFNYGWEAYDEAALLYAYSGGEIDLSKKNSTTYLFCTDEHTFNNALCNRFDRGTTPSEIVMSMIESYEDSYWTRNFRRDRAYWKTHRYAGSMYETMWQVKKFFSFNSDAFQSSDVAMKLSNVSGLSSTDKTTIANDVKKDSKQAVKLALAFYDAIIQQQTSDRPFKTVYEGSTGAVQQLGISADKMFAALFLVGDDGILFDPNKQTAYASFFSMMSDADLGPLVNKILEKSVSAPGPMYYGYESFLRTLFITSATNNQSSGGDRKIVERLRVGCYKPGTMKERFKLTDATLSAKPVYAVNYTNADSYFTGTGTAMVMESNGNFYVAAADRNPYAYQMLRKAEGGGDQTLSQVQTEVAELYAIYNRVTQNYVPDCQ